MLINRKYSLIIIIFIRKFNKSTFTKICICASINSFLYDMKSFDNIILTIERYIEFNQTTTNWYFRFLRIYLLIFIFSLSFFSGLCCLYFQLRSLRIFSQACFNVSMHFRPRRFLNLLVLILQTSSLVYQHRYHSVYDLHILFPCSWHTLSSLVFETVASSFLRNIFLVRFHHYKKLDRIHGEITFVWKIINFSSSSVVIDHICKWF